MTSIAVSRLLTSSRTARALAGLDRITATSRFSTTTSERSGDDDITPSQTFVKTRIRPGEWDPETRTNPLYRPKFRSRAKIWSGDDFARQPTVGFSSEYESFVDAAVTLSWLTQNDQKQIYRLYCDILEATTEGSRTSHEYIVRVVAQKFNLTPERVAAVIQLQHNEEQMIRKQQEGDDSVKLLTEAAEYMDNAIQQEINEAYRGFGLKKPDEFVEDPTFIGVGQESKSWKVIDDLFDVDQLMKDAAVRDEREARVAIDGYVYVEDVDESSVKIPISKDCRELIKSVNRFKKTVSSEGDIESIDALPKGGERRERWKFVAQVVNTRQLRRQRDSDAKKRKNHAPRSYANNAPVNSLVEQNGSVRAATLEDVKQTAWKPVRHVCEHIYQGAKQGWLDRRLRGDTKAWGRAPLAPVTPPKAVSAVESTEEKEPVNEAEMAQDANDGAGTKEENRVSADQGNNTSKDEKQQ
ncbi:hypothetical protein FisN_13Hh114 [Fistulifera solaris]|uniref:Uncharacterized protein n=1 Tax=Fistulifera solaris TaxID=1519565 RepID=A0A1Z5KP39_FISSO|nr:hypothetical protein FisN_13Hh114 [Fistulifera solaris]|eukprot:GAX27781.1 hypothetical protein FisN_13Hh114 [Fistulifera solaris]